ncbi:MAG TPA: methenyltetrahydromethanopterin cyclohydrolase [Thermoleophilia bacterium]|nr:methenyltetrahydromethanopterin cyclohydrolase [Thermoleophilia bacterium]
MLSLNERAAALFAQAEAAADLLEVAVARLPNGAAVLDAGVEAPGSLEAGRLFGEVCLGGLGDVRFRQLEVGDLTLPGVEVNVNHPVTACMASQYAGWAVNVPATETSKKYFAMGSGPARVLFAGEPLFEHLEYRDPEATVAVLALESRALPGAAVAEWVARKCGVPVDRVLLLVAPTASLAGSVQIAARIVETGLHKLHEVGFDLGTVRSGFGACPLAPVAADDLTAIGRTNDGVLYGGRAWYTVATEDAAIEAVIEGLPSSASRDYGVPFGELFKRYEGDFYKIDPLLFSPAEVALTNARSGRTFRAGGVNPGVLAGSLLG